jgi:hypothetical protein
MQDTLTRFQSNINKDVTFPMSVIIKHKTKQKRNNVLLELDHLYLLGMKGLSK